MQVIKDLCFVNIQKMEHKLKEKQLYTKFNNFNFN